MAKKFSIIAFVCVILAVSLAVVIQKWDRFVPESENVSSLDSADELSIEEQAYLADMNKKLEKKFGTNTQDPVVVRVDVGYGEPNYEQKKEIYELLVNNFTLCEIPNEPPELILGGWGVTIGNKCFEVTGYYHYVDDEYVYFKVFTKDNPDKFELYRVDENAYLDIGKELFKCVKSQMT